MQTTLYIYIQTGWKTLELELENVFNPPGNVCPFSFWLDFPTHDHDDPDSPFYFLTLIWRIKVEIWHEKESAIFICYQIGRQWHFLDGSKVVGPPRLEELYFLGKLTDKWGDDRVMFFASQTDQGVEVINVAVGVGHQVLWSHLQFHLDSLA